MGGMIRLDGWMTTRAGEAVLAALHALMPPPALGDTRTPRQRRHDALEDLARDFLDHADTPTVGGEKPHVNVIIDWAALTGLAGGRHEFEDGEVIDLATVQRITCDSSVCRIVFGPNGEIIDVGRRTRVVPAALRRGIVVRDRHCTWQGCDRDPRWCDVHHIVSWAHGGTTEPGNLILLCRYHHTLIHQGDENRGPPIST